MADQGIDDSGLSWIVSITSAAETYQLGEAFGRVAEKNSLLLLFGSLGAGKTTLTSGIAHGLGAGESVPSPSYVYAFVYDKGRLPLWHFDFYRLYQELPEDVTLNLANGPSSRHAWTELEPELLDSVGWYEALEDDAVVVAEWPQGVVNDLSDALVVVMQSSMTDDVEKRILQIFAVGTKSQLLLANWRKQWQSL